MQIIDFIESLPLQIVHFPGSSPFWFGILAIVWSAFQAYAGFQYGLWIYDSTHTNFNTEHGRLTAYGFHHSLFYCVCSLSGFIAWYLLHLASKGIDNWTTVAGGTGAILIALAVVSVAGVSGSLPRILYLGGRPA